MFECGEMVDKLIITDEQKLREHAQYMEERKGLIDAAREAARTFDKAILTFGVTCSPKSAHNRI